jgi:hypothetical protein
MMGDLHRRKFMVILSERAITQRSARFSRENIYSVGNVVLDCWLGLVVLERTLLPYVTVEFPVFLPHDFFQDNVLFGVD